MFMNGFYKLVLEVGVVGTNKNKQLLTKDLNPNQIYTLTFGIC